MINPARAEKFRKVADRRQDFTLILENIHDSHNIGAVLRSADSVGLKEIFLLYTEPELQKKQKNILLGKRTSGGARKWIDVYRFFDLEECYARVRQSYDLILTTHLGEDSRDLYDLDLTKKVALVFGNERDGVSAEAVSAADGNFTVPQIGMAESLNISVAAAVTLYEAYRQRKAAGFYDENLPLSEPDRSALYAQYLEKHEEKNRVWFAK